MDGSNVSKMSLHQKLEEIRKLVEVIQKDQDGYGYKYTSISEILAKLKAGMDTYHVSLVPEFDRSGERLIQPFTYKSYSKGVEKEVTEFFMYADVKYTWINNDNPAETIVVPWTITGSQADPSQATGSALTYSLRYFLTQYFQIATPEDDPDNWRSKKKEAEDSENIDAAKVIIAEFDKTVRTYLESNKDKAVEVKEFISNYVDDSNYFAIKDPALALKLKKDFDDKYINVTEAEQ